MGTCSRQGGRAKRAVTFAVAVLAGFPVLPSVSAATARPVRRVLVFNELDPIASPGIAAMDQAIFAALEKSPYQIEFYSENLGATLFPEQQAQREFREEYIRKYKDRRPDVIVTVGPTALKFLVESHEASFPGIPVVFCGSTPEMVHQLKPDSHFTGVWGVAQPERTLLAALRLQPKTRHVVVTGGIAEYDRELEAIAKNSFSKYEDQIEFTYLTDLEMPVLLDRLKQLPPDSIVYHTAISQDAAGSHFIDATQSVPLVAGASRTPVFIVDDVDLGRGSVGGDVMSFAAEGQTAAAMAVRVLNGEKPKDISIVESSNAYMFDWRAMQRYGLKESDLPPGSVVLYKRPTTWQLYKWYILGGLFIMLAEALLIGALLGQRARRRAAEKRLAIAYARLRLAMDSATSLGWDMEVESGRIRWFGDLQTTFGIAAKTHSESLDDFRQRVNQEDFAMLSAVVRNARREEKPFAFDFRITRPDGAVRWITSRGSFTGNIGGKPERMMGMGLDVTERKRAEQDFRESEVRFELIANAAPVMIWMAGPDKLCTYFNKPWLDFTGRPAEQQMGKGWAEGVHPSDLPECLQVYEGSFDRRQSFRMKYRLRRYDGEYRWVWDIGVPRLRSDGSFAGYIGSCIDATDTILAEKALAEMSGKLIEAQEQERTWIARELHDDINQRIAVLAFELESLKESLSDSDVTALEKIGKVSEELTGLSKDVQALSHRLHSSKLDYLGIVAAARGFCKEYSEQQKVQISFSVSGVDPSLPKDVSLCLFRVLQEALQNGVKHSSARHFNVEMTGTPEEIRLTVTDTGVGFDTSKLAAGCGLGLVSMRERVQLVKGEFSIRSRVGEGTTVFARVPLRRPKDVPLSQRTLAS